ncbi:MAG: hypothetical protein M1825_006183 [Sarcosagium campestre]|nr:MAG: hypothetical protein M1825_006183 [Sarcosagium campestre]
MSTSTLQRLWFRWKALKLPWRRKFLAGYDLAGNSYWEFKDNLNANRLRRIVQYPRSTHYGDVQLTPQWHQWLRHTRTDPPSVAELRDDVDRQVAMKELARAADERWASKPSFLVMPGTASQQQQPEPAMALRDPGGYVKSAHSQSERGVRNAVVSPAETDPRTEKEQKTKTKEDPWAAARRPQGPSEGWQPEAWNPAAGSARK